MGTFDLGGFMGTLIGAIDVRGHSDRDTDVRWDSAGENSCKGGY